MERYTEKKVEQRGGNNCVICNRYERCHGRGIEVVSTDNICNMIRIETEEKESMTYSPRIRYMTCTTNATVLVGGGILLRRRITAV